MPTYGYRCQTCSTEFEVWQKMIDDPVAACPTCGGPGRRQFFPAGIVFKGSGFYKTDSRSASSATAGTSGSTDGAAAKPAGDGATSSPPSTGTTPAASPKPASKPVTGGTSSGTKGATTD